jgi:hypothetical protein
VTSRRGHNCRSQPAGGCVASSLPL